jgi:hypothetical protein
VVEPADLGHGNYRPKSRRRLKPILSVNAGHKHFSNPAATGECGVIFVN